MRNASNGFVTKRVDDAGNLIVGIYMSRKYNFINDYHSPVYADKPTLITPCG